MDGLERLHIQTQLYTQHDLQETVLGLKKVILDFDRL